jgi:hypothetical protein
MNFFEKDLDTLGPMSRCREDWILDQIIHPWSGPPFSIAEAITTLKGSYSPHGSSPRFFEDWRWYKSIVKDEDGFADALSDSYYRQLHNLIDYRHISGQADRSINECLLDYANNIYTDLFEIERGHAPFSTQKIAGLLRNIVDHCPQLNPATIESITNSIRLLTQGMGEVSTIGNWWGRGQQYLSFIRLKAESSTI